MKLSHSFSGDIIDNSSHLSILKPFPEHKLCKPFICYSPTLKSLVFPMFSPFWTPAATYFL